MLPNVSILYMHIIHKAFTIFYTKNFDFFLGMGVNLLIVVICWCLNVV